MDQKYDEILHTPHPRPTGRAPMSLGDRAAQFAPFSALSGHAEGTKEVARTTQPRIELWEDAIAEIETRLQSIEENLAEEPAVSITYFVPDQRKEGGAYVTVVDRVKKIDPVGQRLILASGATVPVTEIVEIKRKVAE